MNCRSFSARAWHATALIGLTALAACRSYGAATVRNIAEIPAAIASADTDFAEGRTALALARMRSARELRGVEAGQRDQLDVRIERFANQRIDELAQPGSDADELAEFVELDLPQQLSVNAGVRAARLYLDTDRPYKSYRLLKKLETQYPRHHGRAEAGAILLEAGLKLADDPSGWWLWQARDDGVEVLEYLVLNYPSERRCDLAFRKLALCYAEDRKYELAIQRYEELVLSHIDSPLVVEAQAGIPHLRLLALESPEYDRKELLRARKELEAWIATQSGAEFEPQVKLDYADCLQRLVESDLGIARFYERIDRGWGARFHAQRALELAREAGDVTRIAACERLLRRLPAIDELPGPVSETAFSADATELRTSGVPSAPDAPGAKPTEPVAPPVDQEKP